MATNSARYIGAGLGVLAVVATLQAAEPQHAADLESSIKFAQVRGLEIYQRDRAAGKASDAALKAGLRKTKAQGWITVRRDGDWLVRFVADCDGQLCSVLNVRLDGDRAKARLLKPPAPLSSDEQNAWRARQLALTTDFRRCSDRYNTVVVPGQGANAEWTVYLLAATQDPNVQVLAGHHRVTVSNDGRTVHASEPLSYSCLLMPRNRQAAGLMLTHPLGPYPIETHVFASLSYRLPLYVTTQTGSFVVDGATIKKLD